MGKTSIEWTDVSWPIVNGCRRKSPGCENCYSERLTATRLSKTPKYGGLAVFKPGIGPQYTGETRLWVQDLDMPLRLSTPSRIFVADMGDLFYEKVDVETIMAVFAVMWMAPEHTFQVLTKRAERMRSFIGSMAALGTEEAFERCVSALIRIAPTLSPSRQQVNRAKEAYARRGLDAQKVHFPIPWVHLGVSVENQKYADERIPHLLQTPAAVRFISAEPLLGPVTFDPWWLGEERHERCSGCVGTPRTGVPDCPGHEAGGLDWIIVGGESGPGARIFDAAHARSIIEQCKAAGTKCFVKQMGRNAIDSDSGTLAPLTLRHPKGADWLEWSEDLRVREFPSVRA
jgi:protein gp37